MRLERPPFCSVLSLTSTPLSCRRCVLWPMKVWRENRTSGHPRRAPGWPEGPQRSALADRNDRLLEREGRHAGERRVPRSQRGGDADEATDLGDAVGRVQVPDAEDDERC